MRREGSGSGPQRQHPQGPYGRFADVARPPSGQKRINRRVIG